MQDSELVIRQMHRQELDVPDDNVDSVNMLQYHEMKEVFCCAKMYFGKPPSLPQHEIYGVTTFELG